MAFALRRIACGALSTPGWGQDVFHMPHPWHFCVRSLTGQGYLSKIWGSVFRESEVQALKDSLNEANTKRKEDTAALSQKLDVLQRKVAFLHRRNLKLSEQLGFLNEVAIRSAVGKLHGKEAAEQAHIRSLQGLCSLLVAKGVPSRKRDAELAACQSALIEAIASPDCFVAFLRLFLGRLNDYHQGNRRALAYIRKAQALMEEVSLHLGEKGSVNRGRVIEAAITQLLTLEAVVTQEVGSARVEEGADLEVDDLDMEDVKSVPPAFWAGRFFAGMIRYLRAAKGGLIKLRAHLAQPDSLGIALLAAASSQLLCMQFELDGRGSLEVFPDSAVITVFEYKSSQSGFAKGKRQLAARLRMLMWAARESGAVPSAVPLTGRGHLYLPGYARIRPQDTTLDSGGMTISIASI